MTFTTTPAALVEIREREKIGTLPMANALGIDRTTLWMREKILRAAPEGFWTDYARALRGILKPRETKRKWDLDLLRQVVEEVVVVVAEETVEV